MTLCGRGVGVSIQTSPKRGIIVIKVASHALSLDCGQEKLVATGRVSQFVGKQMQEC